MVAIRLPNPAMNPPWWARPMSSREESDRGTPYGKTSPENTAASSRHSFALPCLENAGVWGGAPGKLVFTHRFCRRACRSYIQCRAARRASETAFRRRSHRGLETGQTHADHPRDQHLFRHERWGMPGGMRDDNRIFASGPLCFDMPDKEIRQWTRNTVARETTWRWRYRLSRRARSLRTLW